MDIANLRRRALDILDRLKPGALLLGRLGVGLVFLNTGIGKVMHLDNVTKFFATLGIPMPHFNAVLASLTELVCGAALCLGVMTRFAAIPLIITMIVAISTAKTEAFAKAVKDGESLFFTTVAFDETTYIVLLVVIIFVGPGLLSIDHVLAKRLFGADDASKQG